MESDKIRVRLKVSWKPDRLSRNCIGKSCRISPGCYRPADPNDWPRGICERKCSRTAGRVTEWNQLISAISWWSQTKKAAVSHKAGPPVTVFVDVYQRYVLSTGRSGRSGGMKNGRNFISARLNGGFMVLHLWRRWICKHPEEINTNLP